MVTYAAPERKGRFPGIIGITLQKCNPISRELGFKGLKQLRTEPPPLNIAVQLW